MERRLFRSRDNRVFLGVCGGLGEYFSADPVIVRVIAVILTIFTGFFPGVVAYLILALIIPLKGSAAYTPQESFRENISDMKSTTTGLGGEIRSTFENKGIKAEAPKEQNTITQPQSNPNRGLFVLGIIVIALGIFFLLITVFDWFWRYLWPVGLIAAGIVIVVLVIRKR